MDALEDKVAEAAEAAATAAAHAVAAAKAAEEISRVREEAESGAAQVDTNTRPKDLAVVATAEVEASTESTDPNAELLEDSATKPDLAPLASAAETKPSAPTGERSSNNADEASDDLLISDAPDVAMHTVLTRIALMALGVAAGIFVVSLVLVSTVPTGTFFDLVILVAWLGVGALSVGGFALLAAAGIAKVTRFAGRV